MIAPGGLCQEDMALRPASVVPAVVVIALAACQSPLGWRRGQRRLRETPTVRVFRQCRESVLALTIRRKTTERKGGKKVTTTYTHQGSAVIIHPAGYALTNAHMVRFEGPITAETWSGKRYRATVVASDRTEDLAILKLEGPGPFVPVRLGRSGDLMVGEPAYTLGSPFGIRFTLAQGIVSGLRRSSTTEFTTLRHLVQTDAAINPGSSGGPLLNALGECVGICVSAKRDAENIGFAIAIDHVRKVLPRIIAAEQRFGFVLGLNVPGGGPARVARVAKGSPAEAAGIRPGDLITAVGEMTVRSALDFHLALVGRKGGEKLPIAFERKGRRRTATVTLAPVPLRPPEEAGTLEPGLVLRAFKGRWKRLPDFSRLKPAAATVAPTIGLGKWAGKDAFALEFTGYVKVPRDGVYGFYTRSDDGSRLWVGDQLVVDNDGAHPVQEARGFVPLKAGLHRLRVAFFEIGGEESLEVSWEGPGLRKTAIPPNALWHEPSRNPQPTTAK